MSTFADFPANCLTNIHILHDFAEIAYIVCTHAIPPKIENVADATSPDKVLDRLRNAEKQFRQNSILVALDTERLELFTFYRKVDVVKDQRTILHKFGYVCRLNSCTISSKSAARVLELLKPESSRIYRLFTSAVLSSIQIIPKNSGSAIPVGSRVYLVPIIEEHDPQARSSAAFCPDWQLYRVNLQVISSGHLVLTVQNARNAPLKLMSDLEKEPGFKCPPRGSFLYLAPTGQMAKVSHDLVGTRNELLESMKQTDSQNHFEIRIALAQIFVVTNWFKQKHPSVAAQLDESTRWVQVELAVFQTKENAKGDPNQMSWKSLMWPTSTTYIFKLTAEIRDLSNRNATEVDPLKFSLDWNDESVEKRGYLARNQLSKGNKDDLEDDHVFAEEAQFEDHYNPQAFGPPMLPASQLVYPTPPEAVLTHQTPGVSSIDGFAPTPAPILNVSQPDSEPFLDQEMTDAQEHQSGPIGTGFYDEDLFDEIPDEKFVSSTGADEPNWDFFDPPGFENSDVTAERIEDLHDGLESQIDMTKPEDNFPELDTLTSNHEGKGFDTTAELMKMSPDKMESVYAHDLTTSPATLQSSHYVGKPMQYASNQEAPSDTGNHHDFDRESRRSVASRRRSSVFESVSVKMGPEDHDSRYGKHGKFWFNMEPMSASNNILKPSAGSRKRPSSSGSNTSITSSASGSNVSSPVNSYEPPSNKRTWTEYHPGSPTEDPNKVSGIDQDQVIIDVKSLLEVISTASGEDPFLLKVISFVSNAKRHNYTPQKVLMVAQILVDQVSQSSLLRGTYNMPYCSTNDYVQVEVSMDHSGAKSTIGHATLAELTSIPPRTVTKVTNLSSRLICVNRAETMMVTRQSILPFWDILGLQPYHEPKDITAFCLHPSSTNVTDGCMTFLNRLADTYSSCNLGSHGTGRLAGLTNDGLLSWALHPTSTPNLRQLCQRFGSSIGSSSQSISSTIVIYMVSPAKDAASYREICHAFTFLFEAFVDASEGLNRNVELVLQIVPMNFIALADTLVIPNQSAYVELALEVYNRVPRKGLETMVASCGSAVILDENRVRDPTFELSTTIGSPLSKDGPCLHLAYAYTQDTRWLTAAWTDERGLIAFTMSYCLRTVDGAKAHGKRDVFRNMWDVSHDIMGRSRVKWRLVVARVGFYGAEDQGEWQQLVSQGGDDRKLMGRLILLSVDLNPDIVVELPTIGSKATQSTMSQAQNSSGTPVTTPQPNTTSPDQIVAVTPVSGGISQANAATPPDHNFESGNDTETTLVDPTAQTWAVLLAFGLNQSPNPHDIRPAAVSGLLVKRTSSKDESKTLRPLVINLVAAPRSQPTSLGMSEREAILLEMLEQYRGLVTLAASRGCIDASIDCVPWHIATVVKGCKVLGEAM